VARTRGDRGERRTEIIQAATEVIAERGYRGATLAAVADRVGLTQQGLMHHFPTKEALLVAVLEARDQWDMASAALRARHAWPLEVVANLVEYNATRPGIVQAFTVLVGDSVTDGHPAQAYFRGRYAHVRDGGAQTLRAEYGDRLPGGLTPERAATLLAAVMDGLQVQWLLDPEAVDMPAAFRDFLALLAPPPGTGTSAGAGTGAGAGAPGAAGAAGAAAEPGAGRAGT
jgi:AcrR family transcriptional regulator